MLKYPKGWDKDSVDEAVSLCVRMIDSYNSDPERETSFSRYEFAQDIFDDVKVPTQLDIIKDVDPVNYPLIRILVKGASRMVVSAFNGADPFYVFKGGTDSELREAREKDTQLHLETDNYKPKLREKARMAAIKARGPYRIVWAQERKGEGWIDASQIKDGDFEFVGPREEPIDTNDFGLYPLSVYRLQDARAIWHRWDCPMYEIWEKQERGEYFSKEIVEAQPLHEQDTIANDPEDYAPHIYSGIFKLPPGMDRSKPLVAYRMTILYSQQGCLFMEPYTLPMPEYFAPGFEYDPQRFWSTHSLASSAISMNTELNDAQFARKVGAVAGFKKTNVLTGHTGEMTTVNLGLGETMVTPNASARLYTVNTTNPPNGDLQAIAQEARDYAEGVTGFSQIASGQLPEAEQTATATGGALQGTADEGEEKRQNFIEEEIRAVQFRQILIRRNFKTFKKFYGDRLNTKKASDWAVQFTIGANGQGPNNNPVAVMEKLKLLLDGYTQMQIPWLEDVESGAAPNVGVALSRREYARAFEQNLDFPFSTEKIIVDTTGIQAPPLPASQGPFGEIGGADQLDGGIPPELLGLLAGGPPMPFPPDMAIPPPPFELGAGGIDPMFLAGIPGAPVA